MLARSSHAESTKKNIRLVSGIGVNDADYAISSTINGKTVRCSFYNVWAEMVRRCSDPSFHIRRPTYTDCEVCDEWLKFSNFKTWMEGQDYLGKSLDKDIIKPGNKVYCAEYCAFVTTEINNLLVTSDSRRGNYPVGVCLYRNKFMAQIRIDGKTVVLGLFPSPEEASVVYNKAKAERISEIASTQPDKRISDGLMRHANLYMEKT